MVYSSTIWAHGSPWDVDSAALQSAESAKLGRGADRQRRSRIGNSAATVTPTGCSSSTARRAAIRSAPNRRLRPPGQSRPPRSPACLGGTAVCTNTIDRLDLETRFASASREARHHPLSMAHVCVAYQYHFEICVRDFAGRGFRVLVLAERSGTSAAAANLPVGGRFVLRLDRLRASPQKVPQCVRCAAPDDSSQKTRREFCAMVPAARQISCILSHRFCLAAVRQDAKSRPVHRQA